jgi:hypothetical protein
VIVLYDRGHTRSGVVRRERNGQLIVTNKYDRSVSTCIVTQQRTSVEALFDWTHWPALFYASVLGLRDCVSMRYQPFGWIYRLLGCLVSEHMRKT